MGGVLPTRSRTSRRSITTTSMRCRRRARSRITCPAIAAVSPMRFVSPRRGVADRLGRYSAVAADTDAGKADADILLAAANAAFREAQRDPSAGTAAVQRLDGVLQAYASALKAAPSNSDAAYNYEFVARVRDQVARAPQGKAAKIGPITPVKSDVGGDLPARLDDSRRARSATSRREDGGSPDDRADGIRRSRSAAGSHAGSQARAQGVSA